MDSETRKEAVQKLLVSVPDYMQKVQCDTHPGTSPFKCAVTSCKNLFLNYEERDKYPYKFHNFPGNSVLCEVWKKQCGLPENTDISKVKVCSDHFSLDDYTRNYKEEFVNPNFKRQLKPNIIPRKNLPANRSTCFDIDNNHSVSFDEIKASVDENEILKSKYDALMKERCELMKKIGSQEKRNALKIYEMLKMQGTLGDNWNRKKRNVKMKKNIVHKVFSDAQINLLLGKKKVFWSDDDLAKAFTLRHMGSKECYLYLKNQLNLPLPALACVQKWAASGKGS